MFKFKKLKDTFRRPDKGDIYQGSKVTVKDLMEENEVTNEQ